MMFLQSQNDNLFTTKNGLIIPGLVRDSGIPIDFSIIPMSYEYACGIRHF